MFGIEAGRIVVVHCREPREKLWGLLQRLDGVGVALRGLDLGAVDDWLRQEISEGDRLLTPASFFLPMHRVQRIDLDERVGPVPGYADRFRAETGRDVAEALKEGEAEG